MSTEPVDLNSEESWSMARRHAAFLSPIPPSVSVAVQALWKNHNEALVPGDEVKISPESYMAIRRVDKSAKLKTPIYFAAMSLFPDRVRTMTEDDTSKALLEILGPGLFASFLGLIYCHRRLNRICTAPEWESLSKEMVLNMELGYIVGSTIPTVGSGLGSLLGGIRYTALATFLIRSPDIYTRYRNRFKKKFDAAHERSQWGCDHAQICAYLIKDLGFTKDIIEVSRVLRSVAPGENLNREMSIWRAALQWIDSLKDGKCPPEDPALSKTLEATPQHVAEIKEKTEKLFKSGSTFTWMLRASGDDKEEEESKA
ncbi:MAG: hypothetical protein J0M12_13435 [Deltaproteobacteria bacterium]|nr:hypothetical protein [Deltaproteobacteria bacterium]